MCLSVERFSRKNDVKLFAFKYMISMRLSGSLQLHTKPYAGESIT